MIAVRRRSILGHLLAELRNRRAVRLTEQAWTRTWRVPRQASSRELRALPRSNSFSQVPFPRLGPATTFWWGISREPVSPGRAWPLWGHAGRVAERSAADSAIAGEDRVALAPHPASDAGPATRQPPSTVEWLRFQRVL